MLFNSSGNRVLEVVEDSRFVVGLNDGDGDAQEVICEFVS